jgi:FkbM family methyltransferase
LASIRIQFRDFRTKLPYSFLRDPKSNLHYRWVALDGGTKTKFYYRFKSGADWGVIKQIFRKKDYDLRGFPLVAKLDAYAARAAGKKLLVVDAGANIGASAVYFSLLDPQIHVHAIEPEANNFRILQRNCAGRAVSAEQAALAETCKTLWLEDPGQGDWGFRAGSTVGATPLDAIDMAHVLQQYPAAGFAPYICKIDIEGGEDYLFSANTDWVGEFPVIIIELHDGMLPGTHNSRNFLRAIARGNFDVAWRGENMFCFNNDILGAL